MPASLARLAREHKTAVRNQIANLATVSPDDARLATAKQLTHAFTLRQIDQCESLLGVVGQLTGKTVLLVKDRDGRKITVYTAKETVTAAAEPLRMDDGLRLLELLASGE